MCVYLFVHPIAEQDLNRGYMRQPKSHVVPPRQKIKHSIEHNLFFLLQYFFINFFGLVLLSAHFKRSPVGSICFIVCFFSAQQEAECHFRVSQPY